MAKSVTIAPWKIAFAATGSGPFVVKVKLSDLLFDKSAGANPAAWVPWSQGGTRLSHDVIAYNPAIFSSSGSLEITSPSGASLQSERQTYGFFLTKVTPDARAATTVTNSPYYFQGFYSEAAESGAALIPLEDPDYRRSDTTFNLFMPPAGSDYYIQGDYYTQSCTVTTESSSAAASATIVLCNPDTAIEATIPGSSLIPFTRIRINANPALSEVYRLVRFFTGFGVDGPTGSTANLTVNGAEVTAADTLNPVLNTYLQTVEVWLRTSFFTDYVDPVSYLQDLTPQSSVQYSNAVIGTGQFSRFGRDVTPATFAYLPATPPREDLLTTALVSANATGVFPVPSKNGTSSLAVSTITTPVGWYDPAATAVYTAGLTAIPKIGNAYVSGRIFSPTIDELWDYVKKVVSGRDVDTNIVSGPKSTTASKQNPISTQLAAEPSLPLSNSKLGDPLTKDGVKFINAPEGFIHLLNTNIKFMADKIATGIEGLNAFATHTATSGTTIASLTRVTEASLQSIGDWAPRSSPLSLRELEAKVLNLKYNLETAFNYIITQYTPVGSSYTGATNSFGTLYKLHINYTANPDAPDPNSKWITPSNTLLTGVDGVGVIPPAGGTPSAYGSRLPGPTGYDRTLHQDRSDIYLSAEGQWRYLFDAVRIPILDEAY